MLAKTPRASDFVQRNSGLIGFVKSFTTRPIMYRHSKAATFLFPALAGLLSLAISPATLAQRAGRGAIPEQDNTTAQEDDRRGDRPRQHGEPVRVEQASTEQEQATQAARTAREQQTGQRQQEEHSDNNWRNNRRDNSRDNSQAEIERRQNIRDGLALRQQQELQNAQNREIAEREAAAQRLAFQRDDVNRARHNREEMNRKPLLLADNRSEDRSSHNRGDDDSNSNRRGRSHDRNNYGSPENPIAYKPTRPVHEEQQRQWQDQQQRQANDYRRHLDGQHSTALRIVQNLRQQNRNEQYRSQQRYYERMNQQRYHSHDHENDYYRGSYYYSPVIYRYNRGGSYYYANRYQADLMRQAINYGYEEGFYAGRADRADRWGYNYREAYAYQDANYGYYGYYVDRRTYNYYFREGFRRGYDDGYYSRYRYGRSYNNSYSLNDSVLRLILNFSDWRH
jgi:hypothetical protein